MSEYISRLIVEHPADTLVRVKSLLALHQSVDWSDSPMDGANDGGIVLLDEVMAALQYVIDQIGQVQQRHFKEPFDQPLGD